jgi:hypothetical protein
MIRLTLLVGALGCARPPDPSPPAWGDATDWPDGAYLQVQGVLPVRVSGQAVGVDAAYVGQGPELLRLDPATLALDRLVVGGGLGITALAHQTGSSGAEVLVATAIDARVVVWSRGGFTAPIAVADVVGGAFVAGAPVLVHGDGAGGCRVRFTATEASFPFDVACPSAVQVAAVGDAAYVALGQGGLWRATSAGVARVADVADGVSYDDLADQLVVPLGFDERIVAFDRDGAVVWEREEPVRAAVALPGRGVLWARPQGLGTALVAADQDGEPIEEILLERPVQGLAASIDGARVGVVRDGDYGLYEVVAW